MPTGAIAITWMSFIGPSDEKIRTLMGRGANDYVRLYDSWYGPAGGLVTETMLQWGITDPRVEWVPFWRNPFVTTEQPEVLVSLWRLPDRVALMVFNDDRPNTRDVTVKIDLEALGLVPQNSLREFLRVKDLNEPGETGRADLGPEAAPDFDYNERTLTLRGLRGHTGRMIGLQLFTPFRDAERMGLSTPYQDSERRLQQQQQREGQ